MKPIPYDPASMGKAILSASDGKQFEGEYIDMRLDRATLPRGKYAYDCRHDDNGDFVTPVTIERSVLVNFAGTFVTDSPIPFPYHGLSYIPLEGWCCA